MDCRLIRSRLCNKWNICEIEFGRYIIWVIKGILLGIGGILLGIWIELGGYYWEFELNLNSYCEFGYHFGCYCEYYGSLNFIFVDIFVRLV